MTKINRKLSKALKILAVAAAAAIQAGCTYMIDQEYHHLTTPTPMEKDQTLIIGFLGGRQLWNDNTRGIRQLAMKLEDMNITGVEVETFQNRRRDLALEFVHNALDLNQNGSLDAFERNSARLILFGQSLGGSAVVKMSRDLDKLNIPVLLTVQVDSVGLSDHMIPSNVRSAANMYQNDDWIFKGEDEIRPEDPESTRIIANLKFNYETDTVDMSRQPWERRIFATPHNQMDADPQVWAAVEDLILAEIGDRSRPVPESLVLSTDAGFGENS